MPISLVRCVTEYDITPYKPTDARISATKAKMPELRLQLFSLFSIGALVGYNDGALNIATLSSERESYADFLRLQVGHISFRLRVNIGFFGSATMKKKTSKKGSKPDGSLIFKPLPSWATRC